MSGVWRLARAILAGNTIFSLNDDTSSKTSRWRTFGSGLFLSVMGLYLAGASGTGGWVLFGLLEPRGLDTLLVSLYLQTGTMVVFLIGLLTVLSVFYYANDVDKLLPLPMRAEQVVGARFVVALAYEYPLLTGLVLPPLLVQAFRSGQPWFYYPVLLVVFLMLPILPLSLSAILIQLVMRFTPLARNKDRFKTIASLLVLAGALAVSFGTSSLAEGPPAQIAAQINQGTTALDSIGRRAFPGTGAAVNALVQVQAGDPAAWGSLAVFVAASALALAALLLASRYLYLQGVIGLSSSARGRARLSSEALRRAAGAELLQLPGSEAARSGISSNAQHRIRLFLTLMAKDWRVLVRTPVFLLNNVVMNFLWPLFLAVPMFAGRQDPDIVQLQAFIGSLGSQPDDGGSSLAMAGIFAVALFINGTNGIASSALSREGRQFYLMKTLPVSYHFQLAAKITLAGVLGLIGTCLGLGVAVPVLGLPGHLALLGLIVLPGASTLPHLAGIFFELNWPKLNWDNEQRAVKQNMNVLYGMIVSVVAAALAIALVITLQPGLPATLVLLTAGPLGISLILALMLRTWIPRRMRNIQG